MQIQSDFLTYFTLVDELPIQAREYLLDDLSGAPYIPWRPLPLIEQIQAWQVDLAALVADLASIEGWPDDYRLWALKMVLQEPGVTIYWSLCELRARRRRALESLSKISAAVVAT